ncbi:hypothetical protein C1645_731998 [Glomus cerebriforme]|uniref:Uncharacterized protein n=1 Tax=Glomus cerebriforme TaxID=658196 RepID=A0A397TSE5_9GLOM|nr:hypothetical protein C1645_731998 [Glomus cerebriforme]
MAGYGQGWSKIVVILKEDTYYDLLYRRTGIPYSIFPKVDGDIKEEDDDIKKVDDDIDDWWDYSKPYIRYNYIIHFGREVKDELFDVFFKSTTFKEIEHNVLLKALADPKKGKGIFISDSR